VTRYWTPPEIVTIVGNRERSARNYVFHTNAKNTPSGQPEEGYTWDMKNTFSDKVRDIVRKIPKGKTMTYKEVASKAGNPKAARAVGAVMRSNYDPSIPCHRVVASDGKMRGYNRGARAH
jgi:O-6-methylguanine DNA methyltransferase